MTEDQLAAARKIKEKQHNLKKEIAIWETDLDHPMRMAYRQKWNGDHCVELPSSIPPKMFEKFRQSVIAVLNQKLIDLQQEFEEL
jgi:hypothetical protein